MVSPGTVLKEKYQSFKTLLEYDKSAHEFMAALEDMYYTEKKRDFHAVAATYEKLTTAVSGMVGELLKMCPAHYWELQSYYKKFDSYNRFMLTEPEADTSPPYVIHFSKASLLNENLAGKKAFVLSSIQRKLHLPVPDGFVITTRAFHYFIKANTLQGRIDGYLAALDIRDPDALENTARNIKRLISDAVVPEDLARTVLKAADDLGHTADPITTLALRSSAVKEDGIASFAGQYESQLNVRPGDIIETYKQIIASKYCAKALFYRINYGITDAETPMAVLVLEMIDSKNAGVIYTADTGHLQPDSLKIHAVSGPGEQLVSGGMVPETIIVSKNRLAGIRRVKEGEGETASSLDKTAALTLAKWGILLENHFKSPQDIEWCQDRSGSLFILQSRPLNHTDPAKPFHDKKQPVTIQNARLCSASETISPGAATGPVFILDHPSRINKIPDGAVVVTQRAAPRMVTAVHRMAAMVIEKGSRASHFASIAREFSLPAIVNTGPGINRLAQGETITVDADHRIVYKGIVESLIREKKTPESPLFRNSTFMRKLRYVINFSVKLKFTDPESDIFVPHACRSLHDIIRFTHETAMKEMFLTGSRKGTRKKGAKKLLSGIPMLFYVLDVGGGLKNTREDAQALRPENIASIPMNAVLKGLSNPGICWSETTHFDWQEYDRIVMNGGIISADSPWFGSYAILSGEYLNVNFRFGYHFVILDTLCSPDPESNYILFRFSGGGGSPEGRMRRAGFIKEILTRLGFDAAVRSDLIDAKLNHASPERMHYTLDMVGRLLGATKLMDMYITKNPEPYALVNAFMNGRYDFRPVADPESKEIPYDGL